MYSTGKPIWNVTVLLVKYFKGNTVHIENKYLSHKINKKKIELKKQENKWLTFIYSKFRQNSVIIVFTPSSNYFTHLKEKCFLYYYMIALKLYT